MTQLSLFPTIPCHYCAKPIGLSPRNPILMDGFWDNKYQLFVCSKCRITHYQKNPGYFTEMPLTYHQAMIKQDNRI